MKAALRAKCALIFPALLAASVLSLTACGMKDATESVPGKIDRTTDEVVKSNDGIKATHDEVKRTNDQMATMVGQVKKTNDQMGTMVGQVKKTNEQMNKMVDQVKKTNEQMDSMVDQVKKTNEQMDSMVDQVKRTNDQMGSMVDEVRETNRGIKKTNAAVHNQTMAVALAEMMKPENTRYLFPPTGMIPAGKVLAEEATSDELVNLVYVYLTDIDNTFPDPTEKDDNGNWKKETIDRVDHEKKAKFTAASVVAGLAPQDTIDEIIKTQIEQGGRFETTAYSVLMLRYMFINELLLNG